MSACYWLKRVFLPLAVLILMAGGVGLAVQSVMGASFFRLLLSMLSVEIVLVVSSWFFVLDKNEKGGVLEKLRKLIEKSSRRRR
jgi:hypothetical protein